MKRYILDDPTLDTKFQAKYEAAKKNMIARNAAAASKQEVGLDPLPTNDAINQPETQTNMFNSNEFDFNLSFLDQAEPLTSKDQARRDVAQNDVHKARREYEDRRNPEYAKIRDMSLEEARKAFEETRTNANKI